MEKKASWLAFPGIIRIIALIQACFFVLLTVRPEAGEILLPDWEKVMAGEVWRVVAFVFLPPVHPSLGGGFSAFLSILFMFIVVQISFMISDTLEREWGAFRTSLYVYALIICQGIAVHLPGADGVNFNYYTALFFAFATVVPHVQFLLFFIIPVKVWMLATFTGVLMVLGALGNPALFPILLLSFLPYLAFAVPILIKRRKNHQQLTQHRAKFRAKMPRPEEAPPLHQCVECHRTNESNPELDFRVTSDGQEYCVEHLPKS